MMKKGKSALIWMEREGGERRNGIVGSEGETKSL